VNALKVRELDTFYGKSHILHGISLEVGQGKLVALLGRNGAGKTTTLRTIVGLARARRGSVEIFGQQTTNWPSFRIAALGVGFVPEGRRIVASEQEMLAIGRALLLNPQLLLLDEPSQGLAPLIVREVFKVITEMRREGLSILLVEQNVRAALEIADDAYVLDDGRLVYSGSAMVLAKDEEQVRSLAGASAQSWELS
jgi:branched-chain amino acid transport system ATP-binding protein